MISSICWVLEGGHGVWGRAGALPLQRYTPTTPHAYTEIWGIILETVFGLQAYQVPMGSPVVLYPERSPPV